MNKTFISIIVSCLATVPVYSQELNVLAYELTIEPDIQSRSIKGSLLIRFEVDFQTKQIALDAANLEIDNVSGASVSSNEKVDSKLEVALIPQKQNQHEITVDYHGNPKKGLLFNPKSNQAHTVYFTDSWMICNNKPGDRATFSINIKVPKGMQAIASGELLEVEEDLEQVTYKWHQSYESPAYTYGFAIGSFTTATDQVGNIKLHYYSSELNEQELKKVFKETPNILRFFEQKSGMKYVQNSYSQILIGDNYQEMSGLSVLADTTRPSFLRIVLKFT